MAALSSSPSRRPALVALAVLLAALAAGLCLWLVFPQSTSARTSYCSASGDYCEGAVIVKGRRVLRFSTFSLRGRLKVCVTKRTRVCRLARLRPIGNDLFRARLVWREHFPYQGHGTYRVRWFTRSGDRLGVLLKFRR